MEIDDGTQSNGSSAKGKRSRGVVDTHTREDEVAYRRTIGMEPASGDKYAEEARRMALNVLASSEGAAFRDIVDSSARGAIDGIVNLTGGRDPALTPTVLDETQPKKHHGM
jgi:hypothetical protein